MNGQSPPPGWYPDSETGEQRWWDGAAWQPQEQTAVLPPPGWYPDWETGQQRWWDGRAWWTQTARTAPPPPVLPSVPSATNQDVLGGHGGVPTPEPTGYLPGQGEAPTVGTAAESAGGPWGRFRALPLILRLPLWVIGLPLVAALALVGHQRPMAPWRYVAAGLVLAVGLPFLSAFAWGVVEGVRKPIGEVVADAVDASCAPFGRASYMSEAACVLSVFGHARTTDERALRTIATDSCTWGAEMPARDVATRIAPVSGNELASLTMIVRLAKIHCGAGESVHYDGFR